MRVFLRFAKSKEKLVPVINKKKDRVVYVLPETEKDESDTYESIPEDKEDHILQHGKPRRPTKPRRPKKPHKPEIPRDLTPAPLKPPRPVKRIKPVPHLKPVPTIKPVKMPDPPEPRKWKVKKPKPLQASVEERVVWRFLSM